VKEHVSERAFPSSQIARHRFRTRSVSCFLASCAENWGGGPLVASLSASRCACEPHSEGMQVSEREEAKQYRWLMETRDPRERVFKTPRRGPSRCTIHPFSHSHATVTFRSFPLFFFYPCVFLGGPLPRLTYAPRWRSNSHSQWNINDEFVNESAWQRKQSHSFSLHLSYLR